MTPLSMRSAEACLRSCASSTPPHSASASAARMTGRRMRGGWSVPRAGLHQLADGVTGDRLADVDGAVAIHGHALGEREVAGVLDGPVTGAADEQRLPVVVVHDVQ